jgi:hypothetical protein
MPLTEDLDVFFNGDEFAVDCTAGSITAKGIMDMPTEMVAGGAVLSTDYLLTAKASDFGDLVYGSQINVNGVPYTVRDASLVGDGKIVELSLQRSVEIDTLQATSAVDGSDADSTIDDISIDQLDPEVDAGSATSSYLEGNDLDGGAA